MSSYHPKLMKNKENCIDGKKNTSQQPLHLSSWSIFFYYRHDASLPGAFTYVCTSAEILYNVVGHCALQIFSVWKKTKLGKRKRSVRLKKG